MSVIKWNSINNCTHGKITHGIFRFRLQNLIGEETSVFKEASIIYPAFGKNYTEQYLKSPLGKGVEETRSIIMSENYTEICLAHPQQERINVSFPWVDVSVIINFGVITTVYLIN